MRFEEPPRTHSNITKTWQENKKYAVEREGDDSSPPIRGSHGVSIGIKKGRQDVNDDEPEKIRQTMRATRKDKFDKGTHEMRPNENKISCCSGRRKSQPVDSLWERSTCKHNSGELSAASIG